MNEKHFIICKMSVFSKNESHTRASITCVRKFLYIEDTERNYSFSKQKLKNMERVHHLRLILTASVLLIAANASAIRISDDLITKSSGEVEDFFQKSAEEQSHSSSDSHHAEEIERLAQRSWIMNQGEPDLKAGDFILHTLYRPTK